MQGKNDDKDRNLYVWILRIDHNDESENNNENVDEPEDDEWIFK